MKKSDIKKAVSLLYPKKADQQPITKKAACEILGMPYNTAKLDQIIVEYQAELSRWQESKILPLTEEQTIFVIQSYIDGDALLTISKKVFKTQDQILEVLKTNHVPIRSAIYDYHNPMPVPKTCRRKKFDVSEVVFSARYIGLAEITAIISEPKGIYRIWLKESQFFATQQAGYLSSLNHLIEKGIKL